MIKYSDFLEKIQKKETTCVDFTREILDKIEKNKHLNVFITVCGEKALAQAAESDKRFSEGNPRKLEGMIVAVKDNISTKGIRTTCASRMLENFEPIYDATAVERLMAEGAIIIGKTNLDEFAMGSSNETSYFGNVLNPINNEYTPGGSSGGSAAAVAAGLCHVALGSDTGGSVRQPAAFCGTIGLKPTYGRISRWGLVAFASSLDQIGILSADAADTARMLDVISGADAKDSTCANMPPSQTFDRLSNSPEKFTFGVISNELLNNCSTDIINAYNFYVEKLKSLGGEPRVISLTNPKIWIPTYNILAT
ncbi:MAG TPA: amidase family protein, partial [Candidatus Kapabacteria bacterium]|nr:amidase family protein [Candidatus Kapabacteria bacterium]